MQLGGCCKIRHFWLANIAFVPSSVSTWKKALYCEGEIGALWVVRLKISGTRDASSPLGSRSSQQLASTWAVSLENANNST